MNSKEVTGRQTRREKKTQSEIGLEKYVCKKMEKNSSGKNKISHDGCQDQA